MYIILLIPAAILLVAGLFLFVPFCLDLHIENDGYRASGRYSISWLGRTLHRGDLMKPKDSGDVQLAKRGQEEARTGGESGEDKDRGDKRSKFDGKRFSFPGIGALIDSMPALISFLRDLTRAIHIDQLSCNVTFGLDDPSDTAMWSGYLWALACAIPFPAQVHLEPCFSAEMLEGFLDCKVNGRISWAVVAIINAVRKKPLRRLIKELMKDMIFKIRPSAKGFRGWPGGKSIGKVLEH
jgi:hypothetical protein